jgi:hypothetical protein
MRIDTPSVTEACRSGRGDYRRGGGVCGWITRAGVAGDGAGSKTAGAALTLAEDAATTMGPCRHLATQTICVAQPGLLQGSWHGAASLGMTIA